MDGVFQVKMSHKADDTTTEVDQSLNRLWLIPVVHCRTLICRNCCSVTLTAADGDHCGKVVVLIVAWEKSRHDYPIAANASVANTQNRNDLIHRVIVTGEDRSFENRQRRAGLPKTRTWWRAPGGALLPPACCRQGRCPLSKTIMRLMLPRVAARVADGLRRTNCRSEPRLGSL